MSDGIIDTLDSFFVSNGVKQGSIISPLLFCIYIDNLFSTQQNQNCYVSLLVRQI